MKALFATSRVSDGPMGSTKELSDTGKANREKFVTANFGEAALASVMIEETHSPTIHIGRSGDAGRIILQCDGLYTETPNLPIMITHQDCVPIMITDKAGTFVSVLHAGWKGTLAAILPRGIELCVAQGKKLEDLHVTFGPSIQPCHFIVKEDVAAKFRLINGGCVLELVPGVVTVNLFAALRSQALTAGIHPAAISFNTDCTFHDKTYFSWRRDHNPEANMVTVAMLMP